MLPRRDNNSKKCFKLNTGNMREVSSFGDTSILFARHGLQGIVEAKAGDKTLVDTLSPAVDALKKGTEENMDFQSALEIMKCRAAEGRDSTKDMVAKFGRSSRLGERSRGVLDAGATSCCIILTAMANAIIEILLGR